MEERHLAEWGSLKSNQIKTCKTNNGKKNSARLKRLSSIAGQRLLDSVQNS